MSGKKPERLSKIVPRCSKCFRHIGLYKLGTSLLCEKCYKKVMGDE